MNKFRMFVCSLEGRALYIDSDIVFLGRVFDVLDTYTEDILISAEQMPDPGAPQVSEWYYDWAKLKEFDPKFSYPSYCFNAGQFAWTLGKINYSDFQSIVVSGRHLELTRPDIFHCGDQGAMNYVIQKKDQDGNCTVGRAEFAKWINDPVASNYELANLSAGNGYPVLLHWLVQNLLLRKDAPVGHIALLRTVLLFPHSISNYQTEF